MVDDSRFRYLHTGGSKTAYSVLGVTEDAPVDTIQAAFRAAAKRSHPDTGKVKDSKVFEEARYAHDLLVDRSRRKAYDLELSRARIRKSREAGASGPPAGVPGNRPAPVARPAGGGPRVFYGEGSVSGNLAAIDREIAAELHRLLSEAEHWSARRTKAFRFWQTATSFNARQEWFPQFREAEQFGISLWKQAARLAISTGLQVTFPEWVNSPLTRHVGVNSGVLDTDAKLDRVAQLRSDQRRTTPFGPRRASLVRGDRAQTIAGFLLGFGPVVLWWLLRQFGLVGAGAWLPGEPFEAGGWLAGWVNGLIVTVLAATLGLRLAVSMNPFEWDVTDRLVLPLAGVWAAVLLSWDHLFTAAAACFVGAAALGPLLLVVLLQRRAGGAPGRAGGRRAFVRRFRGRSRN